MFNNIIINYRDFTIIKKYEAWVDRDFYIVDFDRDCDSETYRNNLYRWLDFNEKNKGNITFGRLRSAKYAIDQYYKGM